MSCVLVNFAGELSENIIYYYYLKFCSSDIKIFDDQFILINIFFRWNYSWKKAEFLFLPWHYGKFGWLLHVKQWNGQYTWNILAQIFLINILIDHWTNSRNVCITVQLQNLCYYSVIHSSQILCTTCKFNITFKKIFLTNPNNVTF